MDISYVIDLVHMTQSPEELQIKNGWNGFALSLTIYIPLSIIAFFNESVNGCLFNCEYPSYYLLPRRLALLSAFILAIIAGASRIKEDRYDKWYATGVIFGIIVGVSMFVFLTILGWASKVHGWY